MKSRSCRLTVEALEDRNVPSTVAYGDFNHDGRLDMAAITSPTTITVSLANLDGSYAVSAVLKAPKNLPIENVEVADVNADGNLDVLGSASNSKEWITHTWLGAGDGTFGSIQTVHHRWPKGGF